MKAKQILIAVLIPLAVGFAEYQFWEYIDPYPWFVFFPTVYLISRYLGFWEGLIASFVTVAIVWRFFITPPFSLDLHLVKSLYPTLAFLLVSYFFCDAQEKLRVKQILLKDDFNALQGHQNETLRLLQENLALDDIKFSQLANSLPQIVWVTASTGENIFFNEEWYRYTGMTHEESMGHGWNKPFHPDDQKRAWEAWQSAVVNSNQYSLECRLRRFDGQYRWWLIRGVPAFNVESKIDKWFGTCTDIDELKSTAEAQKTSQAKLLAAIGSLGDAICISDTEGNFINFNNAFAAFHKFKSKEECAKTLKEYPLFLDIFLPDGTLAKMEQWAVPSALRGESAFDAEFTLKRKDTGESWIGSYNYAPIRNAAGEITGSVVVARDITKKKKAEDDIKSYLHRLELAMEDTLFVLSKTVDMRDPYTSGHQLRVGALSQAIAKKIGFDDKEAHNLKLIGLIHDIGKIGVPADILSKLVKLTKLEMDLIKTHVNIGYDILKHVNFILPVAEIVREHHERMDGSGYPRGLKGDEILMEARIIAVADVIEAMSTHRPYRPALGIDAALAEIEQGRGSKFDSKVVDACLELFRKDGYKIPENFGLT